MTDADGPFRVCPECKQQRQTTRGGRARKYRMKKHNRWNGKTKTMVYCEGSYAAPAEVRVT